MRDQDRDAWTVGERIKFDDLFKLGKAFHRKVI